MRSVVVSELEANLFTILLSFLSLISRSLGDRCENRDVIHVEHTTIPSSVPKVTEGRGSGFNAETEVRKFLNMGANSEAGSSYGDDGIYPDELGITSPLLKEEESEEPEKLETLADVEVPPWNEQITFRGILVSMLLGAVFCIITHKLNFSVGVIPSLNVAAGLLGFFFIKLWTGTLSQLGFWAKPFTRQENTVIQTTVVSCYGLAFSGGFGSYLMAMDRRTYELLGVDYPGNNPADVKVPQLGWMIAFMFTVSFVGLLALVPLRKIMIIDYALTYPSGTATAVLINSFHTSRGAEVARKQVKCLGKYFTISFFWSMFKWFFSGIGDSCGFDNFPSLGLLAFDHRIYFDFSLTYVGVGLICPHIVNCSVVFGALLSWGLLWPLINTREGDWFPAGLGPTDFKGLYGYKVFIAIAIVLGDGLYNFIKIFLVTGRSIVSQYQKNQSLPVTGELEQELKHISPDEKKRRKVFLTEGVPEWVAVAGYVGLAAISIACIPRIFPGMRWYFVFVCYLIAPVLAFCNSYGTGLTDWSLASTYGKLGLFVFASWAGNSGGVMAGLTACGVMMSIVSTAADLVQDFKTGYLTLSSPRSMFISQVLGTALGCVIAPLTFWIFWTAFDVGSQTGEYKAPYAIIYREMAILGITGFSALPSHCLALCIGFFVFAIVTNLIRDLAPQKYSQYIPIPMAMAIPFYIGAYFAIDMFVGTVILFVWEKLNKKEADVYGGAMASGLICGDGIWTIPAAILSLTKINPPICMTFLPAGDAAGNML
ncbi:hypothetical protein R1flu_013977 [Riccia fluitans]|uniref:Metal-nicotianamine transporter YSL6 n=1 Tax=Riccia fluitans TaxID=41844 RepID=A0ABD1YET4_9MARC